jgi:hypothetical protein
LVGAMEMELDLVLNWSNSKLFMQMTGIKGFKNPNNQSQDWTKKSIKTKDQRFILK